MDPFDVLIEKKLEAAEANGLLRGLPGSGKPLPADDLDRVPRELRMGYKLLKDAGYLPEELELRKECITLDDLLAACQNEGERRELRRRRNALILRYEMMVERRARTSGARGALADYAAAVRTKFGG